MEYTYYIRPKRFSVHSEVLMNRSEFTQFEIQNSKIKLIVEFPQYSDKNIDNAINNDVKTILASQLREQLLKIS